MDITLKNVKFMHSMSDETHCFTATVYVDGKRAFTAANTGHGAPNTYSDDDKVSLVNKELAKETIHSGDLSYPNDLDLVIGHLLNDHLRVQHVKKSLKRICYVKGDGDIYVMPAKLAPTPTNIKSVKASGWWKDSYVVLNELPFDEAKQYFT